MPENANSFKLQTQGKGSNLKSYVFGVISFLEFRCRSGWIEKHLMTKQGGRVGKRFPERETLDKPGVRCETGSPVRDAIRINNDNETPSWLRPLVRGLDREVNCQQKTR